MDRVCGEQQFELTDDQVNQLVEIVGETSYRLVSLPTYCIPGRIAEAIARGDIERMNMKLEKCNLPRVDIDISFDFLKRRMDISYVFWPPDRFKEPLHGPQFDDIRKRINAFIEAGIQNKDDSYEEITRMLDARCDDTK